MTGLKFSLQLLGKKTSRHELKEIETLTSSLTMLIIIEPKYNW